MERTPASTVTQRSESAVDAVPLAERKTAVEVSGLVRRFGEREALAGISTTLGARETLAVFGPNGAGKTTLLRVLSTLLLPHSGSVRVLDHQLPLDAAAVRRRIGFASHDPLLYRELTGRENLSFYARLYQIDEPEERIAQLLEVVGMSNRADDPVRSLSQGMVQRLALCRAVVHRPELLLLDEPRAGLDPDAAQLVEPLIGRASECSRVLVTHDVEQGLAEADRALCLNDGHQVLECDTARLEVSEVLAHYGRGRSNLEAAKSRT
jgi:heme exporter protein A